MKEAMISTHYIDTAPTEAFGLPAPNNFGGTPREINNIALSRDRSAVSLQGKVAGSADWVLPSREAGFASCAWWAGFQ